jgi:hypothetical protein
MDKTGDRTPCPAGCTLPDEAGCTVRHRLEGPASRRLQQGAWLRQNLDGLGSGRSVGAASRRLQRKHGTEIDVRQLPASKYSAPHVAELVRCRRVGKRGAASLFPVRVRHTIYSPTDHRPSPGRAPRADRVWDRRGAGLLFAVRSPAVAGDGAAGELVWLRPLGPGLVHRPALGSLLLGLVAAAADMLEEVPQALEP